MLNLGGSKHKTFEMDAAVLGILGVNLFPGKTDKQDSDRAEFSGFYLEINPRELGTKPVLLNWHSHVSESEEVTDPDCPGSGNGGKGMAGMLICV